MFLQNIKLKDVDPSKKYDVLIPLGSTEQHGPYLPFGTDTYVTDDVVQTIDQHFPEMLILPTLPYSCSKEHAGFQGTIWLEKDTLMNVLLDVCTSLKDIARNFILFTEHGGNIFVLDRFVLEYQEKFLPIRLYHLNSGDQAVDTELVKFFIGPVDQHAGNSEISLMLSIQPSLIDIPEINSPKHIVSDPWETGRLKDKSTDGIADEHPKWIVNKTIGDAICKMMKKTVLKDLNSFLDENI